MLTINTIIIIHIFITYICIYGCECITLHSYIEQTKVTTLVCKWKDISYKNKWLMLFSFTVSLCVCLCTCMSMPLRRGLWLKKKDEYNFCIAIVNTKNIYTDIRIRKDNSFQKTSNNNKRRNRRKVKKNVTKIKTKDKK